MLLNKFDIACCFEILQGTENPVLLASLDFSPETNEYFYYKTSNIVSVMLVPFPPLVSLLPDDKKMEANSDTCLQGLGMVEATWCWFAEVHFVVSRCWFGLY